MSYIYCLVKPAGFSKEYYYLSESEDVKAGDYVEIPFGYDNTKEVGVVTSVELFAEAALCPYPPEKTKKIIGKVAAEHDDKEYTLCEVKPITHKQKTFTYICDFDVEVGDFVDIPFGAYNETRIAKVLSVGEYHGTKPPAPFLKTKKIIRKLSEENSDYVRFIKRNNGQHVINPKPCKYDMDKATNNDGMEPTVTREEVSNFEKAYEVTLPEQYVNFITEVGNGGRGLCKLDVWDYHMSLNYLKYDFILGNYGNNIDIYELQEQLGYECNEEGECETCPNHSECPASCYVDDYEKIDYRYLTGTLPLSYLGCTYTERLVVTGPRAGSVWVEDEGMRMACIADSFEEYINKKNNLQKENNYG